MVISNKHIFFVMGMQDFLCFGIKIQIQFTGQSLVCFTFHYLHLFSSFAFLSFYYSGVCFSCFYFMLLFHAIMDTAMEHASVLISDGHYVIFPQFAKLYHSRASAYPPPTPGGDDQWEMPFFKVAVIHPG